MTSTELVGPLRTVGFTDGTRIVADPPRNTLDPRYPLCTNHSLACDCREAEHNEEISEFRGMWTDARDAAREILAGHRTWPTSYSVNGGLFFIDGQLQSRDGIEVDEGAVCMCTGCQIARKAYLR